MTPADASKHAAALHRQAIVVDGHSDILIPITDGKMKLGQRVEVPDPANWRPPLGMESGIGAEFGMGPHTVYFGPMGQYDIPRFLEGGVTVQVCAIYIGVEEMDRPLSRGLQMAWNLHQAAEQNDNFELVTTVADIHRLKAAGHCGAILSFEGFEALGPDLRFLDLYYKLGLRLASLTHVRRNLFADGPQPGVKSGGLTALGRRAVKRMNELGIVVDLVHINEVGYWEILELSQAPVVLSHSTSTMFEALGNKATGPLAPHLPRPALDKARDRARLEALAANGGVLGVISFYQETIDDVIEDIEIALDVMGPDHVGLGSDFYGLALAPRGLEDMSKVPAITEKLVERGHPDDVILKILGGNYLRVFEQVWGG